MLLCLGANRTIVNERTVCDHILAVINKDRRVYEIASGIEVSCPHFGDLAWSTGTGTLMAISTNGSVVHWAEPTVVSFPGFEVCLVESKRVIGRFGNAIADTL